MLTDVYIEARLVNEELADQAWDAGGIDDWQAASAWIAVARNSVVWLG